MCNTHDDTAHVLTPKGAEVLYGASEAAWLQEQIDGLPEFEYADNFRLAVEGEPDQEGAYEYAKDQGCCGSADFRLGPSPEGRFFTYGFNYGH